MRRFKVVCTLCLGACIPVFFNVLRELLFPWPWKTAAEQRANQILLLAVLVGLLMVVVVAFRVVRYSKLPSVPVILAMVGLIWVVALLNHFT